MNSFHRYGLIVVASGWLVSCHTGYHLTGETARRLPIDSTTARPDSTTTAWLAPYKRNLDLSMSEVLAQLTTRLEKKSPESALNDLLTDALLQRASIRFSKPIDVSHLNYGGIRNGLPAGQVTIGNIFEVMPFDNQLVVLTLTGDQLMQFLNHFAAHDDALVVSGVRAIIHDKAIQRVTLTNGRAIESGQMYTVAMSDYIANGGGDAVFLKNITRRDNVNYLIRDALIDYFRQQGKAGQPLNPQPDGRITIE